MANKRYDQLPAGTYDPNKILLQADSATGALTKLTNSSFNQAKQVKLTLTDTEFKGLPSADVEILADLPAGQFPLITGCIAYWNFAAAGYTNIDSTNGYLALLNVKTGVGGLETTYLRYGIGMNIFAGAFQRYLAMSMSGLLDTTNNTFYGLQGNNAVANISGSGIKLRMGTGLGNLTGGNAANSFTVIVSYTAINL